MFEAVEGLVAEHASLEHQLAAPETHADQRLAKRLNQRYAELSAVVATWRDWLELGEDIEAARELASDDPAFADEALVLEARREKAEERLRHLLVPRDPTDAKDALLEVKSGEGGEESALFAGDLLRMYAPASPRRAAGARRSSTPPSPTSAATSRSPWRSRPAAPPSPARRRTGCSSSRAASTACSGCPSPSRRGGSTPAPPASLVMPRPRTSTSRSTTPTCASTCTARRAPAARASTPPTRRCASRTCRPASSSAARTRRASCRTRSPRCGSCGPGSSPPPRRPRTPRRARRGASQVRTVDRSERIRTYNYPENRISDHRTGYKSYNLDQVLDGDLGPVLQSSVDADLAARLEALDQ